MKNTTNVFLKGMTSDMHPLTTSQQEYTDALNATLITFNGNEQMMLNDMGNTKIQDSKTGNLMGLREGFVPVGLKEHGGIMYIASVNKDGVGEIGTIPSPVIRYNKLKDYLREAGIVWNATPSSPSNLYKITDEKLYTGDKFATILQLDDDTNINVDCIDPSGNILNLCYPQYSYLNIKQEEHTSNKGLYSVNLLAQTDDQVFDMSDLIQAKAESFTYEVEPYYDYNLDSDLNKKYWFVNLPDKYEDEHLRASEISFNIDNMLALNSADSSDKLSPFITYPNIPAGYPSVLFKTENINSFELSTNSKTKHVHPLSKLIKVEEQNEYYAVFPYFIYSTDSAVHVDKIEVCVFDDNGTKLLLYTYNGTSYDNPKTSLTFTISENSEEKRYLINSESMSDFAFAKSELSSITTETDPAFDTDDSKALFSMKIGDDLNKWYTLYVTYKSKEWPNEILGEYYLRFNLYVMDVKGEFVDLRIEEETCDLYYDKSKDPIYGKINLDEIYNSNNPSINLDVKYTCEINSNSCLDINLKHIDNFIPFSESDIKLKYLYNNIPDRKAIFKYTDHGLTLQISNLPKITIKINNTGADGQPAFWEVYSYVQLKLFAHDSEVSTRQFLFNVLFYLDLYNTNDGLELVSTRSFSAQGTVMLNQYNEIKYGSPDDSVSRLLLNNNGAFELDIEGRKILERILETDNDWSVKNTQISHSRLRIDYIEFITPLSFNGIPEWSGRHYYRLYWNNDTTLSDGQTYSKASSSNLQAERDGLQSTRKKGGTGTVSVYPSCTNASAIANYSTYGEYIPYGTLEVNNQGDYQLTYQCNLEGQDKDSASGNYIKYGVTITEDDIEEKISLRPCLINTSEDKLSIIDNNEIFEDVNVSNFGSSFYPDVKVRKLKNYPILFTDPITLGSGVYYLGSVMRLFDYTNLYNSIKINAEISDHVDIDSASNYISITVIPETLGGRDGTPIDMRIASSTLSRDLTPDYYTTKSGREGGILYLPYGGSITGISSLTGNNNVFLINDIGLYEINLSQFDGDDPLFKKVTDANNTAFYEPNRYYDSNSGISYGYYYVSPLLCWVFDEDGLNTVCMEKEFMSLNFGLHAYLTNFGNYYYDYDSDKNWIWIDLPNGDHATIIFRKLINNGNSN